MACAAADVGFGRLSEPAVAVQRRQEEDRPEEAGQAGKVCGQAGQAAGRRGRGQLARGLAIQHQRTAGHSAPHAGLRAAEGARADADASEEGRGSLLPLQLKKKEKAKETVEEDLTDPTVKGERKGAAALRPERMLDSCARR